MKKTNFDKFPTVKVKGHSCVSGWDNIVSMLKSEIEVLESGIKVIAIECYHGVDHNLLVNKIKEGFSSARIVDAFSAMHSEEKINSLVYPYVTDDPVFGYISPLNLADFFDEGKIAVLKNEIESSQSELVIVIGTGATLIAPSANILVYADMPRWEIQLRFRANKVGNIGANNKDANFAYQYKRSFFVDWRVCDRHKKSLMDKWDYILDTVEGHEPKIITAFALKEALITATKRPFRVVPFFDPGPWGGQWLKEVCDLDRNEKNFAWGFDCVPEENSLLLEFENEVFEIPSINLVFTHPEELLGKKVYEAFGSEFPIRFDFLDTMEGGNLSLQVHPLLSYIREKFGMGYTQEESYYFLEAKDDAFVYLGLKEEVKPELMMQDLGAAQQDGGNFDAEKYVEKWPIKKHDHVLIPAGTIHCSGANSVVLEISATPYIFTFKLWDWGRLGLDGKPRPISLEHGKNVIQWDKTTQWTNDNLINHFELIEEGDGWREERTGLQEDSFIETRRHWFSKKVVHDTNGVVNVINLIDGSEIIVESPEGKFEPYVIHYAETFIVPAFVGKYTITPYGESAGKECATLKAYVRTKNLINYRIN
ncbi:MAG: class I mannose-6-phosphate isomerase [Sphingobacteriaceae bacterium]